MSAWAAVARERLSLPSVASEETGRGITVAVVDTGVNFDHPHLRLPASGVGIEWEDGELVARADFSDRYGHGTCCAALIHLLAPDATLLAVRVTGERATTDAERLARGIVWAAEQGAAVIAVAMGTETARPEPLEDAVQQALALDAVVVAADPSGEGEAPADAPAGASSATPVFLGASSATPVPLGRRSTTPVFLGASSATPVPLGRRSTTPVVRSVYPAACAGALGVSPREGVDVALASGKVVAEGRARPAPRLPRNFHGASLASARAAAAVARCAQGSGARGGALLRSFKKLLFVL